MKTLLSISLVLAILVNGGCRHQVEVHEKQVQDLRDQNAGRDSLDRGDATEAEDAIGVRILAVIGNAIVAPFIAISDKIAQASSRPPAMAARQMDDPHGSADGRRTGLSELAVKYDFARKPPYTTRYKQIAQTDPDFTVRAMAIRALNISRDSSATPIFITAMEDENELIRIEAVKALANIPDSNAIPGLLRRLEGKRTIQVDGRPETAEETKDIRIAAAMALRHYKTLDVARSLINTLNERDFAVAWQARRTLIFLTGRDLRYDEGAWLAYLAGPDKPFG